MSGATCAIFIMTFNLLEGLKKRSGCLGAGGRVAGPRRATEPPRYWRDAGSRFRDFVDLRGIESVLF